MPPEKRHLSGSPSPDTGGSRRTRRREDQTMTVPTDIYYQTIIHRIHA